MQKVCTVRFIKYKAKQVHKDSFIWVSFSEKITKQAEVLCFFVLQGKSEKVISSESPVYAEPVHEICLCNGKPLLFKFYWKLDIKCDTCVLYARTISIY